MFDDGYYEQLASRASVALESVSAWLTNDHLFLLADLIDHNEPGVAVEMMSALLDEARAVLTPGQKAQLEGLAESMGLDESMVLCLRALVN